MHHVTQHLQVWIAVGTAKAVSLTLSDAHEIASIMDWLAAKQHRKDWEARQ